MAYTKVSTAVCLIAFLLLSSSALSTLAARPAPLLSDKAPATAQLQGEEVVDVVEEKCGGADEDECLMRRTLAAHIDYIYTQKHNP